MSRSKQFDEAETLLKAMELFWCKGYQGTSMQDLVDHLGINRASMYTTFGDKHQLFEKALQKYISLHQQKITDFMQGHSSVKAGLHFFFTNLITNAIKDQDTRGCLAVNTSTELAPHDPELLQILTANKVNFENFFYHYLKKGQDQGEIGADKDLNAISKYLVCLFNGLKVLSKINPSEEEMQEIVDVGLEVLD